MISLLDCEEFDDIGVYTVYPQKGEPIYDIRGIVNYCEAKGIKTDTLSDDELSKFIIGHH